MDFTAIIPTPSQLLRFARSALRSICSTLKAYMFGVQQSIPYVDFGIDRDTGFLLPVPLDRLPSTFDFWERTFHEAQQVLSLGEDSGDDAVSRRDTGEAWRRRIREGPVICTQILERNESHLQRAHVVLAFLVHFYVHSIPPASDTVTIIVPRTLTIPLVAVSRCLGIAPVLTYSDFILWNMAPVNPELPLTLNNIRAVHLFSGTKDEQHFCVMSAGVELRGFELLQIMEQYQNLPDVNDMATISMISRSLTRVASIVEEISDIIQSIRAGCEPRVFYDQIRPWWGGNDAGGPGWVYEGIDGYEALDLSGPSAGQSPVMHALDIWLDVDHKLAQKRLPGPSEQNKRADRGFMERMRRYMPASHQEFLRQLGNSRRPLRELVRQTPSLREPYNDAVIALKKLRDSHFRMVCLYIVAMSTKPLSPRCPLSGMMKRMSAAERSGHSKGTGGSEVTTLLKAGRDATKRTVID